MLERFVIMQAANTGLTGGSTPDGDDYDGDVVLVNTMRIAGIRPIDGGRQVVCLPGATLHQLEKVLRPLGREPHSVIGSSCLGASVAGGICNNSGGALVRRGPAFTQLALFAQVGVDGQLRLVNHLGIALGASPEEVLNRLDHWDFGEEGYRARLRLGVRPRIHRAYPQDQREIHLHGSTPTLAAFMKRQDAPASSPCSRLGSTRFRPESKTSVFYIGYE